MAPPVQKILYEQVVDVVYVYLGPAAQRFVDREIQSHIGKEPRDLAKSDIDKLHEWCKLAIAMMADDDKTVEEFSENLLALKRQNGVG
jgi:Uri superfamily endonuclease